MANDLWHDMKVLNSLYQELMWDNEDELQFRIEGERIVIRTVREHCRLVPQAACGSIGFSIFS